MTWPTWQNMAHKRNGKYKSANNYLAQANVPLAYRGLLTRRQCLLGLVPVRLKIQRLSFVCPEIKTLCHASLNSFVYAKNSTCRKFFNFLIIRPFTADCTFLTPSYLCNESFHKCSSYFDTLILEILWSLASYDLPRPRLQDFIKKTTFLVFTCLRRKFTMMFSILTHTTLQNFR